MIWAIIEFPVSPGETTRANLTPDGWECPDPKYSVYADVLNTYCPYGRHGPADGDPVAATVRDAVAHLKATVIKLRPAESKPGTIY